MNLVDMLTQTYRVTGVRIIAESGNPVIHISEQSLLGGELVRRMLDTTYKIDALKEALDNMEAILVAGVPENTDYDEEGPFYHLHRSDESLL